MFVVSSLTPRARLRSGVSAEEIAKRSWRRLVPERVHLKDAVRGVEAWLPVVEYTTAEANPLAPVVTSLLSKINGLHKPALRRFAAVFTGVPIDDMSEAELLSVDQLGFDMRVCMCRVGREWHPWMTPRQCHTHTRRRTCMHIVLLALAGLCLHVWSRGRTCRLLA